MARLGDVLEEMRQNPAGVRFADAVKVCEQFFGPARQSGSSHMVFKTPWPGDPRVNIQKGSGGRAKVYQIRQILAAIEKLTSHDKVST